MKKFLISFFLIETLLFFLPQKVWAIEGCFCGPSSSCYPDGCTRKTIKDDGTIDYGLCGSAGCGGAYNACYDTNSVDANRYFCLQQPPCCEEMAKRNDPEACCWPERGYCHPEYCKQVSRPEKCGWYWRWHDNIPDWMARPYGYGCVRGTSADNLQPVCGIPEIAKKDIPPVPSPTPTPNLILRTTLTPTLVINRHPSFPDKFSIFITQPKKTITPVFSSPSFKIPNFYQLIVDESKKVKESPLILFTKLRLTAKKIGQPPKKIYYQIKSFDQKIEDYFNEKITYFLKTIIKHS